MLRTPEQDVKNAGGGVKNAGQMLRMPAKILRTPAKMLRTLRLALGPNHSQRHLRTEPGHVVATGRKIKGEIVIRGRYMNLRERIETGLKL